MAGENIIVDDIGSVSFVEQEQVEQADTQDLQLAALDGHAGWEQMRQHIEDRIKYHRTMAGVDTAAMSLEDVGKRFIISSLVADELEALLNKVDLTKKEVDERRAKANS